MRGTFKLIKGILALLIIGAMASGCSGGDDSSSSNEGSWSTYYAKDAGSLPACAGNIVGRLYYVENQANFQVCRSTGWAVINLGNAVSTISKCSKVSEGLLFNYTVTNFTNGDKFITCGVADASIGLVGSYYWKWNLIGANEEGCRVVFDVDSASVGYWIFERTSGTRRATYDDPDSGEHGLTVNFSASDCSVWQ